MKDVIWLKEPNDPCEAFLGSDETLNPEDNVLCSALAEVNIIYNSGLKAIHCWHHYITRTANPQRVVVGSTYLL